MLKIRQRPVMAARQLAWLPDRLIQAKAEAESGLEVPYRGIATSGGITPGLFPIVASGASTKAITDAARSYLESLTESEKTLGTFDITSNAWREWSNIHPFLCGTESGLSR